MIARRAVQFVNRILWIAVEFPEELRFATFTAGIETVDPAIATAEDDLFDPTQHTVRG